MQVECHPYFPQTESRQITESKNIKIMSWYPLGHCDQNLVNGRRRCKLSADTTPLITQTKGSYTELVVEIEGLKPSTSAMRMLRSIN